MESKEFNKDYLTFIIDDKTLAVPVLALQSINGNPEIIPIINAPEFVVGIFYMYKLGVPILDLRMILCRPHLLSANRTSVIIVRVEFMGGEKLVGFIVDSLFKICPIQVSDIKKLPAYGDDEYIDGVSYQEDNMIRHLSLKKTINEKNVIYFLNQFWKTNGQCANTERDRSTNDGI